MRNHRGTATTRPVWQRVPGRVYLMAAGLLAALTASYFLGVVPQNEAMAQVRTEIQERRAALQLLEVEMAKVDGRRQRLSHLDRTLTAFDDRLPRQGEIDVLLREIWVVADGAGLKTQRIKTQRQREVDRYKVLPLEMSLRGPFDGAYKFLLALERMPGMTKIESLTIRAAPDEPRGCVDMNLVLNVFCKP